MAFHVACPITCRKICFCVLGFSRNLHGKEDKDVFLNEINSLQEFLRDPWDDVEVSKDVSVQIHVPKLSVFDTGPRIGSDSGMEVVAASPNLVPTKRTVVFQKKAAVDFTENDGSCDLEVSVNELNGEDHDHHSASVTCHMCYGVEVGKSERAKMLSCKCCGKKYHRHCLKPWAQHRDLFNWSSWACPSCRICEGCGTLGDPKKLMFCKRCDAAYHCDCQQPRHKNVSSGPYLCPKHTKCYSCGSKVPGNGQSLRWFLGHTCCDSCGRLFVKGNYCPVCLKVYRDSESTPMVCCDFCQRWVHCHCDGISDEKYLRFQVDGNIQYKCATCRGECYQIKDLEDAVQEIWKRKDIADKDLIASLKASARVIGQTGGPSLNNQPGSVVERKASEKAIVNGEEEKPLRVLRIKSSKLQDTDREKIGKHTTEVKTKKLVIHVGPRKTGVTNSMSCDVSKLASNSSGKQEKLQSEETSSKEQHRSLLSRSEVATSKAEGGGDIGRHSDSRGDLNGEASQKDSRRLLKLKIKKHNPESQEGEEALSVIKERGKSGKGHRSKRKRAALSSSSSLAEKSGFNEDEDVSLSREDSLLDEILDASWILKKLGKDAKGKQVQIHESSDDSWEKGVVSEVGGGDTSKLMVTMENGKVRTVEIGKQRVRFVPQKQKRTKM